MSGCRSNLPVGRLSEKTGKVGRGMPSCLQAVEEEGCERFKISFVRILPNISMESPVNESVEDTRGLCGGGRPVQVQVHGLLEGGSSDAMYVVQLEGKVQESNRTSGFRGFPFESSSWVAKGVHSSEEG